LLIIVLASIMGVFMCPSCFSTWEHIWKLECIMITIWLVMWYGNGFVSQQIDRIVSWIDNPIKRFIIGIFGSAIFSSIAIIFLAALFESIFNISIGDGWSTVWISIIVAILILLFMQSLQFLSAWRDLALREVKMKNEVLSAKFELLKSQINPHFMFNSLNTLNSLIYQDQNLAAKYLSQLSKVYRSVLATNTNELVTIEEELVILQSYIFLQTIRFEDRFNVEINLSDDIKKKHIPPMVLQMLIENCIKHNEITRENPLHIEVADAGDMICVKNSIMPKQVLPGDNASIGLANIKARYEALSNVPVEVFDNGRDFIVKLPILTIT